MKIRYQNGKLIQGITLFRNDQTMRVVVSGAEDAVEFTNIHGTWVSEDCEPVIMETGRSYKNVAEDSVDDFICPRELAEHLVSLLCIDSTDDAFEEQQPEKAMHGGTSPMIA